MITMRQIERQFGIAISPLDGGTRVSLYLRIDGSDLAQRRINLEREMQNQRRALVQLGRSREQQRLLQEFFLRLEDRLFLLDLSDGCHGVAAFGDSKNLVVTMLPRLSESFAVVADSFHIRPLLRLPELFLRYVVVTLHGGHVAAYAREPGAIRKLFSFTPPATDDEGVGRVEKKRRRNSLTLEHAASRIASLSDTTVAVFGPRYLRTRFRKTLAAHRLRPPAFEADADMPLEALVGRADRVFGQQSPPAAVALQEHIMVASREGRLVTRLPDILRAAAIGAIDTFVITSPDVLWSEAAVPMLRGQVDPSTTGGIVWSARQRSHLDDCILDDVGETVLRAGGQVAELPLLRSTGTPAFAVLRWRMQQARADDRTEPAVTQAVSS